MILETILSLPDVCLFIVVVPCSSKTVMVFQVFVGYSVETMHPWLSLAIDHGPLNSYPELVRLISCRSLSLAEDETT